MPDTKNLEELRSQIDSVDRDILHLSARRASLSTQIAKSKTDSGLGVRDSQRERDVMDRAIKLGEGLGLEANGVERLFQTLIDVSLRGQRAQLDARADSEINEATVAYLGGPGTYSHFAAQAHFGPRHGAVAPVVRRDFSSIIKAAQDGEADYAFLPIENTTTGGINEVYDLLLDSELTIVGEYHYRVRHCLVGRAGSVGAVRKIYGHPQALAQCRRYLSKLPDITQHFVSSSTRALEHALEDGPGAAAIAGADAARLFGLNIVASEIGDTEENYTRFIALAAKAVPPSLNLPCKTSLVFATAHEPGSLVDVLTAFRNEGINLAKLQSRPVPGAPWEEMFFLDIERHQDDTACQKALKALNEGARRVRILGCYGADRLAPVSVLASDEKRV